MSPTKHQIEGGAAVAEGGLVLLDGPDGVAVAMTPEAARATARELMAAADEAAQQEPVSDGQGSGE